MIKKRKARYTRGRGDMLKQDEQQRAVFIAKSGSLKAAKMTIPLVISKWGVNNESWARTLQLYSDYLIRY